VYFFDVRLNRSGSNIQGRKKKKKKSKKPVKKKQKQKKTKKKKKLCPRYLAPM